MKTRGLPAFATEGERMQALADVRLVLAKLPTDHDRRVVLRMLAALYGLRTCA